MKLNNSIKDGDSRCWENTYCRSTVDKKRNCLNPYFEENADPLHHDTIASTTSNDADLVITNNLLTLCDGQNKYANVDKINNLSLDRSFNLNTNEMDIINLQHKETNCTVTETCDKTDEFYHNPCLSYYSSTSSGRRPRYRAAWYLMPGLKSTSCLTIILLVFLETVLLSTVSNCAKTFYMHWNTTNSIFRIDNTDHIIDVNKGNLQFEYDQVHIICPVYEPGTFENETEKYIIYNVSKVEYETCRITNANPRIIAICDKPQKLMFFTITFRPFTPQPGGLEFLPGNDYYFISTSSKDDLHRRIGGRCSTNNMKVVFKVCCAPEESGSSPASQLPSNNQTQIQSQQPVVGGGNGNTGISINQPNQMEPIQHLQPPSQNNRPQISKVPFSYNNNNNHNSNNGVNNNNVYPPDNNQSNIIHSTVNWANSGNNGGNTVTSSSMNHQPLYPYLPSTQRPYLNRDNNRDYDRDSSNSNFHINNNNQSPSHNNKNKKTNDYDKLPNEVVKNEELTYNSNGCNRLGKASNYRYNGIWQLLFFSNSLFINLLYTIIIANSLRSVLKPISIFFNDLSIRRLFLNVNKCFILSNKNDNKHCDDVLSSKLCNSEIRCGASFNFLTSEDNFKFKPIKNICASQDQHSLEEPINNSVRNYLRMNLTVNSAEKLNEEILEVVER